LDLFVVIHQVSWIFSQSGYCTFHSSGRQREVFLESPFVCRPRDRCTISSVWLSCYFFVKGVEAIL
jgi:hypothetical protein